MKILALDIENLPAIVSTFEFFNTSISHKNRIENTSLISVAWQFTDEKTTHAVSIADDRKRFERNIYDDNYVAKEFHKVLSSSDDFVILAHNGKKFDLKKLNTSFIKNGLPPVPKRQVIDTLLEARKHFDFDSNRLDFIGRLLKVGEKINTGGMQLWNDILQAKYPEVGHKADIDLAYKAMNKMVKYNKQDVKLLISVFNEMRRYIDNPNWTLYNGKVVGCTICGSQDFRSNGFRYNQASRKRRFWCRSHKGSFDPPAGMIRYYEQALNL